MATEVGRIVARYIADTTSFDRGNARVQAGMHATGRTAQRSAASWAQYGKYGVLATGAAVVGSLKSFALFDRNMNIYAANQEMRGKQRRKQMKEARDEALRLGKDARFPAVTAAHVAETMVELSKAGLKHQQVMKSLEPVMLLGTAGQMEFADAGAIAANAMQAFQMPAARVGNLVDYLAGAALKSSSNVQDIAEAFRYASTSAAGLGVPVEQVTTLTGLLSNLGLKGDMAGTSMRMFFTSIAKPRSNKAAELMKDLGLMKGNKSMFFNKKGEIKSIDEIADLWRKATRKMTKQESVGAAHTIFGVRGMNVARVLERGGGHFRKFQKESTKAGSANRLAAANTQGLYGAYQRLVNIVQTLGLELGEALAPYAIQAMDALSKVGAVIGKHPRLIKALALAIVLATVAWGAWRATLLLTRAATLVATTSMTILRGIMMLMLHPIQSVTKAMRVLRLVFLTNPFGIILLAVIALILILRRFGVGLDDVKNVARRVWASISHNFMRAYHAVRHWLTTAINWVKKNWPYIVGAMLGPIGLAIAAIYKNWGRIKRFFADLKNWIVEKIRSAMTQALQKITGAAQAAYNAAIGLGKAIIRGIVDGIKSAPGAIVDAIAGQIPGGGKAKALVKKVVPGLAKGGPAMAGRPYIVGERGPEWFVPRQNGTVLPNGVDPSSGGGGGSSVIVENMNVRSEDDVYSIASVLGQRMRFA